MHFKKVRNKGFMFVVAVLAIMILFSPVLSAHAAPAQMPGLQETMPPPIMPGIPALYETVRNLGGLALLFSAAFNAAKKFGWLQDSQAPAASLIFNTFSLVGLVVLQFSGRTDLVPIIDQNAGTLATVLTGVIALIYQLWVSRKGHESVLAGLPVIGYSHSGRVAGENTLVEIGE